MEPLIRNIKSVQNAETGAARLVGIDDNPPTCTMTYSEIQDGKTSTHHIHPWEHEVYIIEGAGTLVCDGKEYTVSGGDGVLVPPDTFHQWRNTSQQPMTRVTFNPLASEAGEG